MRRFLLPLGLAASVFGPCGFSCDAHASSGDAAQRDAVPAALATARDAPDESGVVLTLERALELADARSFSLSAARREVDASEGSVRQAAARPNPQLHATLEDTRRDTRSSSVVVELPLELGEKRPARIAHARLGRDLAVAEMDDVRATTRAAVIAAFFRVLLGQERVALGSSSLDVALRGADAAARRVAAGRISPIEETRARVERANAELAVAEARADLQVAREALAALWGSGQPGFPAVAGDLERLPERAAFVDLVDGIDRAPGVLASRLHLERRRSAVGVERSRRHPDLRISLGAKRDNELGLTQAIVGVSVALPLFDANQGNIDEAVHRAAKADEEYQATRLRLVTELRQAVSRLASARASAQTLRDVVLPAARQANDAAVQGFDAGKLGLLDLLDTQRTLLQARVRYLDAAGEAYAAAATIDRLLGH